MNKKLRIMSVYRWPVFKAGAAVLFIVPQTKIFRIFLAYVYKLACFGRFLGEWPGTIRTWNHIQPFLCGKGACSMRILLLDDGVSRHRKTARMVFGVHRRGNGVSNQDQRAFPRKGGDGKTRRGVHPHRETRLSGIQNRRSAESCGKPCADRLSIRREKICA